MFAQVDVRLAPGAAGIEARRTLGCWRPGRRRFARGLGEAGGAAGRLDVDRLDDDFLWGINAPEARLMGLLERPPHLRLVGEVDLERRVGAGIAQLPARAGDDFRRSDALRGNFRGRFGAEFSNQAREAPQRLLAQ